MAIDASLVGGTSTGDSTYWSGLIAGLAELSPEMRFLLIGRTPRPASLPAQFEWLEVKARSSRWWNLVSFPLAARRAGAHAIHTQYSLSPLVGHRGLTTIHDVSFFIGPNWFRPRDRFMLRTFVPAAARRAAKVITVSETSKGEIESYIPAARGKTIATPLACPPWIERVDRATARQVASDLGVDGPFILTVGTRWPRKNMGLAIEAASLLPEDLPHRLVVTGKQGWGGGELGQRGVATGYVTNEQLSSLYSAADLYLAPSWHEGFGLPVLEAFRCGCPVVCSAGGAFPEVAGDAAFVQEGWYPHGWAATVERLLRDPSTLDALRQTGFEREKQFTWKECARRTLEAYREVLST